MYTFEHILSSAGIQLEDEIDADAAVNENPDMDPNENELSIASVEELEALLQEAIEQEDYERASEIRDELNKRS